MCLLYLVCECCIVVFNHFFFSSRIRHTKYWRDWSSDVLLFRSPHACRWCRLMTMTFASLFQLRLGVLLVLALVCVSVCVEGGISKPVIKWEKGGCRWPDNDGSWDYGCKQSWYGQPYVGDIDGDGTVDIVGGNYLTYMLDGQSGVMDWYVQAGCDINNQETCTGSNRMWPDVAVADLDSDGDLEYVTAHGGSLLCVYNADGTYHEGWKDCKKPRSDGAEIRAMTIADLNHDGQYEIIIGYAISDSVNLYVLDNKGDVLPGWPQRQESTVGSSWFIGSNSIGVADLAGDKKLEIISPSDTTRVMAYHMNGNPVRGFDSPGGVERTWGEINTWEHLVDEDRGWASCSEPNIRVNGIRSCTSVADLDGDGEIEITFTGNAYDCSVGDNDAGKKFTGLFIVDKRRKRYKSMKGDWESIPSSMGPMKIEGGYGVIETWNQYSTPTDLDGDGVLEVLVTGMDGKLHAWWLDQTEKYSWPFASPPGHYLTEPVIVDIDRDGKPEVITNSWTKKGSNKYGKLFVLSWKGEKLYEIDLPQPPNHDWGGSYSAPIACNLDDDGNLDVLVMQIWQGITAYTFPKSKRSEERRVGKECRSRWSPYH
eukprot:TRINITY_DN14843_c0_g1_i2.p1 TRINITY_DN14843_c0_g1~~TRINITY_DN14843_c0_g1_i2.p1  ORF type:complete len:595 (-),score=66.54 TRINITY_DN14843_c0_g1_i2:18-1802(-)